MKIIKEPNLSLTCPVCGCEFEFNKNDVYNATGGMRKGIPKNPHKAVYCPICDKSISIWGNKTSKHDTKAVIVSDRVKMVCTSNTKQSNWSKIPKHLLDEIRHARNNPQ